MTGKESQSTASSVKAQKHLTAVKMKRNNLLIILLKENTSVRLGKTNLPPQQLNQLLIFHLEQEAQSGKDFPSALHSQHTKPRMVEPSEV